MSRHPTDLALDRAMAAARQIRKAREAAAAAALAKARLQRRITMAKIAEVDQRLAEIAGRLDKMEGRAAQDSSTTINWSAGPARARPPFS
jgi:hypothetical protein